MVVRVVVRLVEDHHLVVLDLKNEPGPRSRSSLLLPYSSTHLHDVLCWPGGDVPGAELGERARNLAAVTLLEKEFKF